MNRKILLTYSNSNNETKTKTISYANPNASDATLLNFANDAITELTENSIIKVEKVDTTILHSESD